MEILVKAVSVTHADSAIDKAGCYKKGYPVVAMPDGWAWGKDERLPLFVVIKVPGVIINHNYLRSRTQGVDTITGRPLVVNKRDYTFLESIVDSAIANGGALTLTNIQLASNIKKVA